MRHTSSLYLSHPCGSNIHHGPDGTSDSLHHYLQRLPPCSFQQGISEHMTILLPQERRPSLVFQQLGMSDAPPYLTHHGVLFSHRVDGKSYGNCRISYITPHPWGRIRASHRSSNYGIYAQRVYYRGRHREPALSLIKGRHYNPGAPHKTGYPEALSTYKASPDCHSTGIQASPFLRSYSGSCWNPSYYIQIKNYSKDQFKVIFTIPQ